MFRTQPSRSSILDCPVGPRSYLVRGALDLLVLSVLHEQPLVAEEIADAIEIESAEALNVSPGHLHKALQRLSENGCIRERDSQSETRVAYRCTPKGRKIWEIEQMAWARLSGAVTQVVKKASPKPSLGKSRGRRAERIRIGLVH